MKINIYDSIIKTALKEDIGFGDITTENTVPEYMTAKGNFIAKDNGIICGINIAKRVFEIMDSEIEFNILINDGSTVKKGDIIAKINGNARSILTGERVALNFLQHLSGIATKTNLLVNELNGTKTKICDTRKTSAGQRVLEKYAVKIGGGVNHRFNLADGVLIKDNHIKASGGIKQAVENARKHIPHTLKIEVETENAEMIKEALLCKADIIMLDNMTLEQMKKAVQLINGRAIIEASGNMGDKALKEIAETGVDLISVGALTHSVKAFDISLKFE
jgi:nicotinate-nucleotide pyrophosphorylase (carboxylating)